MSPREARSSDLKSNDLCVTRPWRNKRGSLRVRLRSGQGHPPVVSIRKEMLSAASVDGWSAPCRAPGRISCWLRPIVLTRTHSVGQRLAPLSVTA